MLNLPSGIRDCSCANFGAPSRELICIIFLSSKSHQQYFLYLLKISGNFHLCLKIDQRSLIYGNSFGVAVEKQRKIFLFKNNKVNLRIIEFEIVKCHRFETKAKKHIKELPNIMH